MDEEVQHLCVQDSECRGKQSLGHLWVTLAKVDADREEHSRDVSRMTGPWVPQGMSPGNVNHEPQTTFSSH